MFDSPVTTKAAKCESPRGSHAENTASCSDVVALARTNLSCVCVKLGCCTHVSNVFCRVRDERHLCRLDGKLQIYYRKNANPVVFHLSILRVWAPRHARAHRGHDIIAAVALIAAIVGVIARTDSRNECVTRLEVNIQAHVRVNIHASLCRLVGFRKHVREHAVANPRWVTDCSRHNDISSGIQLCVIGE